MPGVGCRTSTTRRFPAAPIPRSTFPASPISDASPIPIFNARRHRYQFTDNFSLSVGRHNTKFGGDVNYLPLTATFTVNYGGVYDFGSLAAATLFLPQTMRCCPPRCSKAFPRYPPVQSYGSGVPGDFIQGLGSPSDKFKNIPIGVFFQDSWRISPKLTLNYGVRYDVEIPPKFKQPQGLALPAYRLLGLQKGIQTDKNNIQPRIGLAFDPEETARP